MDSVVSWEADILLADGTTARIRPISPGDADALQRFHVGQSERSTYFRFFAPMPRLSASDLERLTTVDHYDRVALVVIKQEDEGSRIIAVGRFDRYDGDQAEVAFNVSDSHHGRGLGSILLEHLAAVGRELGITRFTAEVLPGNAKMLSVFDHAGYSIAKRTEDGVVMVSIGLDPTEQSTAVMADREWRADVASMNRCVGARDIVLVLESGGISDEALVRLVANLERSTAAVTVRVTAPPGGDVAGLAGLTPWPVYPIEEISGGELALLAVSPAAWHPSIASLPTLSAAVLYAGGTSGVDADVTSFADTALAFGRRQGVRLLGPASAGFRVTRDDGVLDVTTLDLWDGVAGHGVGIFCQSAVLARMIAAQVRQLRVTSFFSAGSRVDLSGNDVLQWWAQDSHTRVHAIHLESLGNARKFARATRRLATRRPVIVVTGAFTGVVSAPGHRVRATTDSARTLPYLLRQSGVIRATDLVHLCDLASLCAREPRVRGDRVAVIADDPAASALAAGELKAAGLQPVAADADADAVLAVTDAPVRRAELPAIWVPADAARGDFGFASPRYASRLLATARSYQSWTELDQGTLVRAKVSRAAARGLIRDLPSGPVGRDDLTALLACYGIALQPVRIVESEHDALAAAAELGLPVALTTTAPTLRHRADLGAVRLGIATSAELQAAYTHMRADLARLDPTGAPLRVQSMAPTGAACVIRSREDPLYGPVLGFGIAGDAVDLLDDVTEVLVPATEADLATALTSIKAAKRLMGGDGLPPIDVSAIRDVMGRVALLADDNPEVAWLEMRPVVAGTDGAMVLDARMELAPARRGDNSRRKLADR